MLDSGFELFNHVLALGLVPFALVLSELQLVGEQQLLVLEGRPHLVLLVLKLAVDHSVPLNFQDQVPLLDVETLRDFLQLVLH